MQNLIEQHLNKDKIQSIITRMQQSENKTEIKWNKLIQEVGAIYVNVNHLDAKKFNTVQKSYIEMALKILIINQVINFPMHNAADDTIVLEEGFDAYKKYSTHKQQTKFKSLLNPLLTDRYNGNSISPDIQDWCQHSLLLLSPTNNTIKEIIDLTEPTAPLIEIEEFRENAQQLEILAAPPHEIENNNNISTNAYAEILPELWDKITIINSIQKKLPSISPTPNESFSDFKKRTVNEICEQLLRDLSLIATNSFEEVDISVLTSSSKNEILNLIYDHFKKKKEEGYWPGRERGTAHISWTERQQNFMITSNEKWEEIEQTLLKVLTNREKIITEESQAQSLKPPFKRKHKSKKHTYTDRYVGGKYYSDIPSRTSDPYFWHIMQEPTKKRPMISTSTNTNTSDTADSHVFSDNFHINLLNPINEEIIQSFQETLLTILSDPGKYEEKNDKIIFIIEKYIHTLPIDHKQLNNFFIQTIEQALKYTTDSSFYNEEQWIRQENYLNNDLTLNYIKTKHVLDEGKIYIELNKNHALMLKEALSYLHEFVEEAELSDASTISMSSSS